MTNPEPGYDLEGHHDAFMSNFFAQPQALALGRPLDEVIRALKTGQPVSLAPHKAFPGNRPTNAFLLSRLTPRTLGALIAMYEHEVFATGVMMNVFSFDQWGVELGKELAKRLLPDLANNELIDNAGDSSTTQLINRFKQQRAAAARSELRSFLETLERWDILEPRYAPFAGHRTGRQIGDNGWLVLLFFAGMSLTLGVVIAAKEKASLSGEVEQLEGPKLIDARGNDVESTEPKALLKTRSEMRTAEVPNWIAAERLKDLRDRSEWGGFYLRGTFYDSRISLWRLENGQYSVALRMRPSSEPSKNEMHALLVGSDEDLARKVFSQADSMDRRSKIYFRLGPTEHISLS